LPGWVLFGVLVWLTRDGWVAALFGWW